MFEKRLTLSEACKLLAFENGELTEMLHGDGNISYSISIPDDYGVGCPMGDITVEDFNYLQEYGLTLISDRHDCETGLFWKNYILSKKPALKLLCDIEESEKKKRSRPKFEYHVEEIRLYPEHEGEFEGGFEIKKREFFKKTLAELGEDGWELVSTEIFDEHIEAIRSLDDYMPEDDETKTEPNTFIYKSDLKKCILFFKREKLD